MLTEQKAVLGNPQMADEDVNSATSNVFAKAKVRAPASNLKLKPVLNISGGGQSDAPSCNNCRHIMVRSGTCFKCIIWGTQGNARERELKGER